MSPSRKNYGVGSRAALYILISLCFTIGDAFKSQKFKIGSESPTSFKVSSPNVRGQHVLNLTAEDGTPQSAAYLQSFWGGNHVNGLYGHTQVNYVAGQQTLVAHINLGTQLFQGVLDTGSSDIWVVGEGFQCIDVATFATVSETACSFGPTYTISPTFKRIPNPNYHTTYVDGSSLRGTFGYEKVAIAGIPVQNQQIAIVDHATYVSDGVSTGLIGLAFPLLTEAFVGTDSTIDTSRTIYNPILTNLFSKKNVAPVFSLAIERSSVISRVVAGGLLAIGGLPPGRFSPTFGRAPFQLLTIDLDKRPLAVRKHSFYTIVVKGYWHIGSKESKWTRPDLPSPLAPPTNPSQHRDIADNGTTLIYLPTAIASAVNTLFGPPAVYDANLGAYAMDRSAKTPSFGIEIGKRTFFINGKDLIGPRLGNGICASGIEDVGSGMSVLWAMFLRNVLAVFDIGASEMRFAARDFY